jgi:chorismate synthase
MSGSIIGKNFAISTWGESHGKALGVTVDGCPAGLPLVQEDIQKDLDRRRPGQSPYQTPRREADRVEIMSGVFQNKTTGSPISMIVFNQDSQSRDYNHIKNTYRPGHSDYSYDIKYGFRDYRGGGRSSGRETLARVAAGAVAKKILSALGIDILAYTLSIGNIFIDPDIFDAQEIYKNPLVMPDKGACLRAENYLDQLKERGDSAGGTIECIVTGLPAGVGEPVFQKLDSSLSGSIFSIGAVKGIEFGSGFAASELRGSQNNDPFELDSKGIIVKKTNNAGGILGGISDGSPIVFRVALKPTPSISLPQETVDKEKKENIKINIRGRHDPTIVPRAVVVVEAMTAITLVDLLFQRLLSNMDLIKKALL